MYDARVESVSDAADRIRHKSTKRAFLAKNVVI